MIDLTIASDSELLVTTGLLVDCPLVMGCNSHALARSHSGLVPPISLSLSSLEPPLIRSDRRRCRRGGHQFDGKMRERKMHRRSFMPMAFRRTQVTLPEMERAEI